MTPANRLDSVPSNVLRGASVPNAIAGFGRPTMAPPPDHAVRLSSGGLGVIAALALLAAVLFALLGGRVS